MPDPTPRTGIGFDVHRFGPGRPLWLGGVLVPDHDGLVGHSDGDAVCHALADAVLGAAALGDVGEHFPDTDPAVAGIVGTDLLARAVALAAEAGRRPTSADVTVIADTPAVAPLRDAMRAALAGALHVSVDVVSVPGDPMNVKITTMLDLAWAEARMGGVGA